MQIKILVSTSINCKIFEKRVYEAVSAKGIFAEIERIHYLPDMLKYGVIYTPALVIEGKLVSSGKILTSEAISRLIH
ncbi:thioredoxin family protein [Bacillaceae bacterium IKA-2]|nr:thioredoxin family protein [Bacillaceae bacterium IKA-2]